MSALAVSPQQIKDRVYGEGIFITIVLSKNLLENPLPIRCIFCGNHLNVASHYTPLGIVTAKYKVEDCNPLLDVRCKLCKLNYRLAK